MTLPVLLQSGIGKIVTELRKSADAVVSARAQALRTKWKAMVVRQLIHLIHTHLSLEHFTRAILYRSLCHQTAKRRQ